MGIGRKQRSSEKLSAKLLAIRQSLSMSQMQMVDALQAPQRMGPQHISSFERGLREPPLSVVLSYARLAGVNVEALIDDSMALPREMTGDGL